MSLNFLLYARHRYIILRFSLCVFKYVKKCLVPNHLIVLLCSCVFYLLIFWYIFLGVYRSFSHMLII